LVIVHRWLYYE